jgi:uncharacterized membrane protein
MKPKQGKYLFIIGIILILAGLYLLTFDELVAGISLIFGLWTAIKGYRVSRGIQPYLVRKHQEKEAQQLKEFRELNPFEKDEKEE